MNTRDTLITELNVLENFDPILPEAYQKSEYIMLGNLTPAVQMRVLDQLPNNPKLVVMDTMNFWMDVALNDLLEVIKRVDVLTINDEEIKAEPLKQEEISEDRLCPTCKNNLVFVEGCSMCIECGYSGCTSG